MSTLLAMGNDKENQRRRSPYRKRTVVCNIGKMSAKKMQDKIRLPDIEEGKINCVLKI